LGNLLTTKVKLQARPFKGTALLLALICTVGCAVLQGCSADLSGKDYKASVWEQQWLDGTDALSEGRLVDARRLLESAVNEARSGGRAMRVAITLDRLGDSYMASQMIKEAEKSYTESLALFEKAIKKETSDINQKIVMKEQIGTMSALAGIWLLDRKYKKAEKLLDQAVGIAKLLGVNDLKNTKDKLVVKDLGSCLQKLGFAYEAEGRTTDAEQTYFKASKLMPDLVMKDDSSSQFHSAVEKNDGDDPSTTKESKKLNEMIKRWSPVFQSAETALAKNLTAQAQMQFRRAYQMSREVDPASEPAIDSLTQLMRVTNKLGQYPETERLFNENKKELFDNAPTKQVDNALGQAAKTYIRQHKWGDAERILVRRVKVREILRGPTNFHVAETLSELGSVYVEMHQISQAELVLKRALKIVEDSDQMNTDLAANLSLRLSTLKQNEK
jgi:tetratricopeptide (TPR) repeat protein